VRSVKWPRSSLTVWRWIALSAAKGAATWICRTPVHFIHARARYYSVDKLTAGKQAIAQN
jgi:hypothetical protein